MALDIDGLDWDGDGWASEVSGGTDCDDADADLNWDDVDADGQATCAGDCNDADAAVYDGAPEICGDGIDQDCAGDLDEEMDGDGDGYAECEGDCDDTSADLNLDDLDGDGWDTCEADCDDGAATVYPGATERCDGQDNNCDGVVETSWAEVPGDYLTIQEAIDDATPGRLICVQPGTFYENVSMPDTPIHLVGTGGPDLTVIDGDNLGTVLSFGVNASDDSIIEGFTLTHGLANNGGGLYVEGVSPTIRFLRIEDNTATGMGGGAYLAGGSPVMEDVEIVGNSAIGGEFYSAYYGGLGITANAAPVVSRLTVSGNTGGWVAVGVETAWPTLDNMTISDNDSGGLSLSNCSPIMTNVEIVSNSGTGLWLSASNARLTSVRIIGNDAGEYEPGGGIYMSSSNPTMSNAVIVGNSAGYGGGINLWLSDPVIGHTIVAGNSAAISGGGVYSEQSTPVFEYSSFWDNIPSDVYGMATPVGVNGNLSADAEFLDATDPDPRYWDLHLSTSSPLIDAGDPTMLDPDGSTSDIGVYGGSDAAGWDRDWDGYFGWWQPGEYDYGVYPQQGWDCDDSDEDVYPGNGC